ncbi:MAG: ABC transporter ATP-binding protein [Bryobacteraceae bacterium]
MITARIKKVFRSQRESAGFTLDIEFNASAGVTVLFGSSGSGKTLTLDCIAGFIQPDEGRILLDDVILFDAASNVHLKPQARRCGYVFQNYALFPHMTLRENLMFAAQNRPRLERHRRVNEMLETFGLTDMAGRKPAELSGGQKQRCSIARALVVEPKLLLLDEPAQGLDAPLRSQLYEIIRRVREEFHTPVFLVTHDLEECLELGDEMMILRDGKIVQSGAPARVVEQPANPEMARLLGIYNLLPVEIRTLDPGRNSSRYRLAEFELTGPYFPGRLLGDRVLLCVRPDQLKALPRDGKPAANQIPAMIERVSERPGGVRLDFGQGLLVDVPRPQYEAGKRAKEWLVEFPTQGVRVL